MAKYKKELVSEIVSLIESDIYTVKEICNLMRISRQTFYEWMDTKPEFKEAIDEAMRQRDEMLVSIARASLRKKLEGYTLTEEKITYEPAKSNPNIEVEKSRVVRKKQYPPDLRAIRYVLEREEKRKEKEDKPKHKPTIIQVPDQHTADNLLLLEKNLRGTEGEMFKVEKTTPSNLNPTLTLSKEGGICEATKKERNVSGLSGF